MSDLKKKFEAAVANSKNLTERPDNATLLKIYALYKQASSGDNTEKTRLRRHGGSRQMGCLERQSRERAPKTPCSSTWT
jgi:hypothetical protein